MLISAILASVASGYLTVTGYTKLFSSIGTTIAAILIVLEIAKVVIAGVVVKYKMKEVPQKPFLALILGVLVMLSAIGHYGFLTSAYYVDKDIVSTLEDNSFDINQRLEDIRKRMDELSSMYRSLPDTDAKLKSRIYKETATEMDQLRAEQKELQLQKKQEINTTKQDLHASSVIKWTAKMLHLEQDTLANIIIGFISLVLDPLALFMVSTFTSIPKYTHHRRVEHSKSGINIMTVKDYDVQGNTVEDIIAMSDEQLRALLPVFNTDKKRDWLAAALCWREAHLQGVTMDLDFQCDGNELVNRLRS